ncbi:putative nucleoredoxin 1-2 isoform X1 [Apium graveolens]|uniref:putative nucleoredoxin 1-2 isoform X1 n=1 Tax=Apium graveolens TaxID=4045 RepID=UPI003D793A9D
MLWDSKTVLRRRDKSEVEFSEVVGKRIILLIGISWVRVAADSLSILKSKYSMLKDTDDDFEVIQIFDLSELAYYKEHVTDLPWLVHHLGSHQLSLLLPASNRALLIAFNPHGQVVRRATTPCFKVRVDATFPFYAAGDLEEEVYSELYIHFN